MPITAKSHLNLVVEYVKKSPNFITAGGKPRNPSVLRITRLFLCYYLTLKCHNTGSIKLFDVFHRRIVALQYHVYYDLLSHGIIRSSFLDRYEIVWNLGVAGGAVIDESFHNQLKWALLPYYADILNKASFQWTIIPVSACMYLVINVLLFGSTQCRIWWKLWV